MLADDLRMGLDPVLFAQERLGITPDPWQERVLRWPGKRLLLNCSRQAGKSTVASVLVLHRAVFFPGSLSILVSPSLRQSSELFRKVAELLDRLRVKPKLLEENKLSFRLACGSRVLSLPASEATIRGFSGADLIIEDESSRVPDDLYRAVRPMLAVSGGKMILMSTPFGKRGHFFEEWQRGLNWERIGAKATDCPRIDPKFLEEERVSLGDWWFRQEYMCEFVETTDQVFSYEAIMGAMSAEVKPLFG
ncbi:MAG: hypothetical protein HQL91_06465 [Magnetococcales bacterium]|nr:hypothetical protein [Magnetococcales bacterium]